MRGWARDVAAGACGMLLLLAALGLAGFLWLDSMSYRYWPASSEVPVDGAQHVVPVAPDGSFILWRQGAFPAPECEVTALPSGDEVPLRELGARRWERAPWPFDGFGPWWPAPAVLGIVAIGLLVLARRGFREPAPAACSPAAGSLLPGGNAPDQ